LKVIGSASFGTVGVVVDGTGLSSRPGSALLALTAQRLGLTDGHSSTGEHAIAEPKRLRYRILHVAGQITGHARRTTLHLPADWPSAAAILRAFKRLGTLPADG
jgi:hypothetical protein